TLVCTIFFIFLFVPEWWIIPFVTIVAIFTKRYISYKGVTYYFDQDIICYKKTIIQFEHINEIAITQTFFQRKLDLATTYILYETGRLSLQHIPLIHAEEMQEILEKRL